MGSTAEVLDAAVESGRVTRRELGSYLEGKGIRSSSISRALGPAVKKWGRLAKVKLLSDVETNDTEDGYIPNFVGANKLFKREASDKFLFGPDLASLKGLYAPYDHPLFVDVTAREFAANCRAKVTVFPRGISAFPYGEEVQAYWQPGSRLTVDLNSGESAKAEILGIWCTDAFRYRWHAGEKDSPPSCFVRTPSGKGDGRDDMFELSSTVNLLVLTVYSADFFAYFPFLFLKKKLTQLEMIPIIGYTSKEVGWSGKGSYVTE
ncbi:MAG: hypothetical protein JRN08_04675 [Nitrososphaerota archaeon]|nr:hypothetical protein [Nitrososphaerota archaeon]